MEEKQAIDLLRKGDLSGLEALSERYYIPAVKTAYLITQSAREAEDVVQSTFLRACAKIHQLRNDRFGPWFMRSVVHAAIKCARRQQRLLPLEARQGEGQAALEDLLADPQPSPETTAEKAELTRLVRGALQRLPAEERAAVVMRYYLGLSEFEMTSRMQRPLSTVKWWLYSARRRLRGLIDPGFTPPSPKENKQEEPNE